MASCRPFTFGRSTTSEDRPPWVSPYTPVKRGLGRRLGAGRSKGHGLVQDGLDGLSMAATSASGDPGSSSSRSRKLRPGRAPSTLHLVLAAVDHRVAFVVAALAVGLALDQRGAAAGAGALDRRRVAS